MNEVVIIAAKGLVIEPSPEVTCKPADVMSSFVKAGHVGWGVACLEGVDGQVVNRRWTLRMVGPDVSGNFHDIAPCVFMENEAEPIIKERLENFPSCVVVVLFRHSALLERIFWCAGV